MARGKTHSLHAAHTMAALKELGVAGPDISQLEKAASQTAANEVLVGLKAKCKKGHRRMAHACHPDVTGEDSKGERSRRFNRLTPVYKWFMEMRYTYRPSQPAHAFNMGDDFSPGGFTYSRPDPFRVRKQKPTRNRPAANDDFFKAMRDAMNTARGREKKKNEQDFYQRFVDESERRARETVFERKAAERRREEADRKREVAERRRATEARKVKQRLERQRRRRDKELAIKEALRMQEESARGVVHQFRGSMGDVIDQSIRESLDEMFAKQGHTLSNEDPIDRLDETDLNGYLWPVRG